MSDAIEDYILANRGQHSREVLTEQMVAAGHGRTAIDAAWSRLTKTPTPPPTWEATAGRMPDQIQGPIVIRTYRAKSQADAAQLFQADAGRMAAAGYYPVSQSWAQGQWGCGAFLIALVLCIVLIGILIFIYLLVVKPDGTLTVTYQFRAPPA